MANEYKNKMMKVFKLSMLFVMAFAHIVVAKDTTDKVRLIVTTDLGGSDPDDIQSMVHLLVCSDRIDIEGLISSQAWFNDPDKTAKIQEVVSHFGEILPNLQKHSIGFPPIEYLSSVIKQGQEKPHMDGVGEGKDSPGSELIIATVDKKGDKRPVWLTAWGGMNTIAQALWKVKSTRSEKDVDKFISKIRIYDILGQDDSGAWIAKNFPEIVYIRNKAVYGWTPSDSWIKENIQSCKPLGDYYPNRIWVIEGDSPAFLHVYANGLNAPDHLDYGGWGGRFSVEKKRNIRGMDFIVKSGKNESQYDDYYMFGSADEGGNAINKWKQHIWNDFAARMLWSTTDDYDAVNHHPIAIVDNDKTMKCLNYKIKAGKDLQLNASQSSDPDNDVLTYNWFVYQEPSLYKGKPVIESNTKPQCRVKIPADASGKNIHVILEVTDNGTPSLTAYRRIVIEVL